MFIVTSFPANSEFLNKVLTHEQFNNNKTHKCVCVCVCVCVYVCECIFCLKQRERKRERERERVCVCCPLVSLQIDVAGVPNSHKHFKLPFQKSIYDLPTCDVTLLQQIPPKGGHSIKSVLFDTLTFSENRYLNFFKGLCLNPFVSKKCFSIGGLYRKASVILQQQ